MVKFFTVQVSPVPSTESHPPQPPKVPFGAAVIITSLPLGKELLEQTVPVAQLRPNGVLDTDPDPEP